MILFFVQIKLIVLTHYKLRDPLAIGAPIPSKDRTGWNWFSAILYGTRLHLGQWGAKQIIYILYKLCFAPCCPRGSLVPYKSEEHQFCGDLLMEKTVCGMPLAMQWTALQTALWLINSLMAPLTKFIFTVRLIRLIRCHLCNFRSVYQYFPRHDYTTRLMSLTWCQLCHWRDVYLY